MKLLIEPSLLSMLAKVSNLLTEQNIQSYVVGGFIRDVLLGRDTADIDIAIMADALKIAPMVATALSGKYVLLDRINKVSRVILAKEPPAEGQWYLDFSTVKDTITKDLAQRDFTIDAMAIDTHQLGKKYTNIQLIDPSNGQDDLYQGVIRVVAETAFEADAARLLRAVRLAAELGFSLDSGTEILIQRQSRLLANIAGERVREELLRLLAVPHAGQLLPYLNKLGLITALIPELAQAEGVEQPREHYWNVFDHSLQTVTAVDFVLRRGDWEWADEKALAAVLWSAELSQHFATEISCGSNRRLLLKLAAFLHDIAKPQAKVIYDQGKMRFLGHAQDGALIAASILERLRFSTKEVKLVETMVRYHLRPMQMSQPGALPSSRAIYRYFRDSGEAGIDIQFLSLADHLATRGPRLNAAQWQEHTRTVNYVLTKHLEQESLVIPPKLIDGHDLMNTFGLRPGPKIGEFLEQVREARASGELTTREEAFDYIREHLLSRTA